MRFGMMFFLGFILMLHIFFLSSGLAENVSVEKDMNVLISKLRNVLIILKNRSSNSDSEKSFEEFLQLRDVFIADHLVLKEIFDNRARHLESLGKSGSARHSLMRSEYESKAGRLVKVLEEIKAVSDLSEAKIAEISDIIDSILVKKKARIYGSFPYSHLNFSASSPLKENLCQPAYKGGNIKVEDKDLESIPEAEITEEISKLAQSLEWNPVEIYQWVKNNIKTEYYYGLMKGAENTLHNQAGNDADQAALLLSLLRASDYPARIVRGTISFNKGIGDAQKVFGIEKAEALCSFLRKSGIPYEPVIKGGKISNIRFEHIWVEALIPYSNYRGAVLDENGLSWFPLDTSIKQNGVKYNEPFDILPQFSFTDFRDKYLSSKKIETPMEFLEHEIDLWFEENGLDYAYEDIFLAEEVFPEKAGLVPSTTQFSEEFFTGEYHSFPEELKNRVRFTATHENNVLFEVTKDTFTLAGKKITIEFEPETVEDQEIINSFGGIFSTPQYLVRLRPVLKVGEERIRVSGDGLASGEEFEVKIELLSPNNSKSVRDTYITGNIYTIIIAAGDISDKNLLPETEKTGTDRIYDELRDYVNLWNHSENQLAQIFRIKLARPFPAIVRGGGVADVVSLGQTNHQTVFKGLFTDADLRFIESEYIFDEAEDSREKNFMLVSSMEGSFLEGKAKEKKFGVESVSTAELFGTAREKGMKIIRLDSLNSEEFLPQINVSPEIKDQLKNYLNDSLELYIPEKELAVHDWAGTGFIFLNPETGESGWMLSGNIAGAMTVFGPGSPEFENLLEMISQVKFTADSDSARYIYKVAKTDMQKVTAGEKLKKNLEVIVTDSRNIRVKNARVLFSVKAGGGSFFDKNGVAQSVLEAETNFNGIAEAEFVTGSKTSENKVFFSDDSGQNSIQAGLDIVDAEIILSGVFSGEKLNLETPFRCYGMPGEPAKIKKIIDVTGPCTILSSAGSVSVLITDVRDNPVANTEVEFSGISPSHSNCLSNGEIKELKFTEDADCSKKSDLYRTCAKKGPIKIKTKSDGTAGIIPVTGGVPGALYLVKAKSGNNLESFFNINTYSLPNCTAGSGFPDRVFEFKRFFNKSSSGDIIDVAGVGGSILLNASISYLREDEEIIEKECGDSKCFSIKGLGNYEHITEIEDSSYVKFNGDYAKSKGNGLFPYDYKVASPGRHDVEVSFKGVKKVKNIKSTETCDECCSECGKLVDEDFEGMNSGKITVYGVEIRPEETDVYLPVNNYGYLEKNVEVECRINPAEYKPANSLFIIYENGIAVNSVEFDPDDQGNGLITISEGTRFSAENNYSGEIVLNYGLIDFEMRSEKINLNQVIIDLQSELVPAEKFRDSPEETIAGIMVLLNDNDDNFNKIPDMEDWGEDVFEEYEDRDLAELNLIFESINTGIEGKLVLELCDSASETIKIWKDREKTELLAGPSANDSVIFDVSDQFIDRVYVEGIKKSNSYKDSLIKLVLMDGDESIIHEDNIRVTVVSLGLVTDYDRNGKINDSDRNMVSAEKPWRFWVNNDNDNDTDPKKGVSEGKGAPPDLPGQNNDNSDIFFKRVNGVRDLVDFFPVMLDIKESAEILPEKYYEFRLSCPEEALSIVKSCMFSPEESLRYLRDPDTGYDLRENKTVVPGIESKSYILDKDDIERIRSGKTAILAECIKPVINLKDLKSGKKEPEFQTSLDIEIYSKINGKVVLKQSLPISVTDVTSMYGLANYRHVGGGDRTRPDRKNFLLPFCMNPSASSSDKPDNTLIWVHGYNVDEDGAEATFAEVFKRLYHSGYKGSFYGVCWYGDPLALNLLGVKKIVHFHQAQVSAFNFSGEFAEFIKNLDESIINVAAHSLGNLAVGAAIQDKDVDMIKNYFAIDAAVLLEAYGDTKLKDGMINVRLLKKNIKKNKVNSQSTRNYSRTDTTWKDYYYSGYSGHEYLLSSEWFRLFDKADNRSQLTWRKRLSEVPEKTQMYNFYSSTEDVLGNFEEDKIINETASDFVSYSFVKQEKLKGRSNIWPANLGGGSSSFGGWGGNLADEYYAVKEIIQDDQYCEDFKIRLKTPCELGNLDSFFLEKLRKEPFFLKAPEKLFDEESGSSYVFETIGSHGELYDYFDNSKLDTPDVSVRDFLLAEAFPGTTWACGSNENGVLKLNNFNMSTDESSGSENYFMTYGEKLKWPREKNEWWHSDYKNISYNNVHKFYEKLVAIMK